MARKNLSLPLQVCDLCNFSSKNWYIYKRHRIRCRKEHGITKGKKGDGGGAGAAGNKENPHGSNGLDATESLPGIETHESGPELSSTESNSAKESAAGDVRDEYNSGKPRPSVNRNYKCTKCDLRTNRSRVFLYHLVEVHNSKTDIYACRDCEYCSRYRHKIQRHMKIAHKLDIPHEEIFPEHESASKRKVSLSPKMPRKVPAAKTSGRKLMVKFSRPQAESAASPESPGKGKKSPNSKVPAVRSADQLSRVVEEVQGEDGTLLYKCRECPFVSDDKQKVAKHMVSWHVDIKHFNCTRCGYICFERNDFLSHRLTHRNEHQYRCEDCTYSTDFRPNYERHLANHRGSFPFKCSFCSYGCGSEAAIRRHMALNHDVVPNPPKKMKMPVPKSASSLPSNAVTGDTEQLSLASDSQETLASSVNVKSKKGSSTNQTPSSQTSPSKTFFDASSATMVPRRTLPPPSLSSHHLSPRELSPMRKLPANITRFVKREKEKLVCPACNEKGYKRSSDLNRHMKRKHGCRLREYLESMTGIEMGDTQTASSFLGDLSDMSTSNLSGDDMNDDTYEEMIVDDDLNDSGEMPADPGTRSGEEDAVVPASQLQCKYCNYEAKLASELRRHLSVHSIEKRFKCSFCPKKYKYIGDMNLHIRKDHNKEPSDVKIVRVATIPRKKTSPAIFKCPCCTYTSAWKSEVDRHSRLHTGEKTYQCSKCDYQTYWRGDVRRHVYKHHPEVMTEGVSIEDVVIFRKDRTPELASASKANSDVQSEDTSSTTSSVRPTPEYRTPESSPSKDGTSHESTPEPPIDEHFSRSEHSPTPSPIKELGGGLYKCQYCGFEANAPSKINSHIESHTNLKRYMCPMCGRRANWKWDITKHIKKDHNADFTQVVKLTKAEAEATIQSYIDANPIVKREHHLNTPEKAAGDSGVLRFFKCSACDFSSEKRVSLSKHIRYRHEGKGVNIVQVKRKSPGNSEETTPTKDANKSLVPSASSRPSDTLTPTKFAHLLDNFVPEHVVKPFMCSECGKRAASKGDVKKHFHYVHPDREIRIIYLGDGSQSVYSAKPDSVPTKAKASPTILQKPEAQIPPPISPSKSSEGLAVVNPKVLGYIKPFKCSLCGRRSNWRWDLRKHLREKHSGQNGTIVELTEEEARASYDEYQAAELPQLNKSSNSIPRKRHVSEDNVIEEPALKIPKNPGTGSKGTFRHFKCSACAYRSNWKTDILRHVTRRHGAARAKVVVLDKTEAEATIGMYNYSRGPNKKNLPSEDMPVSADSFFSDTSASDTSASDMPAADTPATNTLASEDTPASEENKQDKNVRISGPGPKKIWKCCMCPFMDVEKIEALKHIAQHNMKAYRCLTCNWTSNFRSAVYKHIRVKHQGDDSAVCRLSIKLVTPPPQEKKIEQPAILETPATGEKSSEELEVRDQALAPVYCCKLCAFRSRWRSCVCRHIRTAHDSKEYCKNMVKRIIRVGEPRNPEGVLTPSKVKQASKMKEAEATEQPCVKSPVRPLDTDRIKHRPKNFKCSICPYRAAKSKMIKFHMSCHKPQPGIKQVKCKFCPYYVNKNRLLAQHTTLHIQELSTQAVESSFEYPTTPVKDYSSTPSPTSNKRHRCEKCPYTSNSKNDYLYHKQFHRPKPTADFKCDYCDYWVTHRRLIKQHMKVHQLDKGFVRPSPVPTPTKSEYSENSLVYDTIEYAALKQRIIASKITPSISQTPLISPMKIASSCMLGGKRGFMRKDGTYRKIHKCRSCPYMNLRLRNMKLHELMHGKRSATHPLMKCPHCDYYVGSKGLLAHHLKVHQPDYGMEFIVNDKEKGEENATSEDSEIDTASIPVQNKVDTLLEIARFKKYGCEKCPYASSKRVRFQRHVELHGSKQKYKCDYCDYSVPTTSLLNQHQKLHFEPNQNLLAAQSILNLQYLPEMPADVALASMLTNNDSKHPVSVTHDHIDLYENTPEDSEPKKIYRCDRCPYANIRRDHLLAHLRCHMIKNTFSCPYCDYSVGKIHVLMQHVKVHFSPLPELSEWLNENGDAERIKEIKEKNLQEAIELAKLFQNDIQFGKVENGTVAAGSSETAPNKDKKVADQETVKAEGEKTESKDEKKETPEEIKDEKDKVKEETYVKIENGVVETKEENEDVNGMDFNMDTKKEPRLNLKSDGTVGNGEDDSNEDEEKMEVDKKEDQAQTETANGIAETEGYVCQYCDRDFQTSDCLVRHEMQHLIGNSYEELVVQLSSTPKNKEEPVAGPSGIHGNGNGTGGIGEEVVVISDTTNSQAGKDETDTIKLSGSSIDGEESDKVELMEIL